MHHVSPPDYEELRVAVVMNGGVSLAVWIGGVAHEINRAMRREDMYGALLEFTATTARVDVVSGASAGGINGALLSLALVFDADLSSLREVWLERGSLDRLLHSPYDSDMVSLLRGNDRFFEDLRQAFKDIKGTRPLRPPSDVPLHLSLTTTMLHGEPNRIADDFGVVINDVDHRGRFDFRRGSDGTDKFADEKICDQLALAARASASFPVAFEPVFCPVDPKEPVEDKRFVDMKGIATFARGRFLLDGGILDNKPLEEALRAVFRQRADREVRRVLAYVVPAPGHTAAEDADEMGKIPTIGEVAMASLLELPRVESISAQLESIVEHNRQVTRKRQTRVALMRELKVAGMRGLAKQLWDVYRRRRMESAADYIVGVVALAIANKPGRSTALGRRQREWLVRRMMKQTTLPWIPDVLPAEGAGFDAIGLNKWVWGAFTLENIAQIMLDLFRRALIVTPLSASDLRARIKIVYAAGHDLIAAMPRVRGADQQFWGSQVDGLLEALEVSTPRGMIDSVDRWIANSIRLWSERTSPLSPSDAAKLYAWRQPSQPTMPLTEALGWIVSGMAGVIAAAADDVRSALKMTAGRTEEDRQYAADLLAHIDYLAPEHAMTAEGVLVRLLALDVVQYATGTYAEVPDQFVELVQVSANGRSPLGGASSSAGKLAGVQLGNFGGFYKKSWRANDWMFGRLDGADRLVRILLNPARLARLYPNQANSVLQALHGIAVPAGAGPEAKYLEDSWKQRLHLVTAELAYLDDPDYPVPEYLPQCVEALVTRLHLTTLRSEMPVIAGAADDDRRNGVAATGPTADFLAAATRQTGDGSARAWAALPSATLVQLFRSCQIGEERLTGEVGSDLFTSTLTRTMAVVAGVLTGPQSGVGVVRHLLQSVRFPLLIVDALAQNAVMQSRTATSIGAAATTLGGTLVALDLFTSTTLPLWAVRFGTTVFVAAVALWLRRRPRLVVAWLAICAAVWFVRSYLPVVAERLGRWLTLQLS